MPASPSSRTSTISVMSLTASTERQDSGNLPYVVIFQLRESSDVAVTISSIEITMAGGPGASGTTTVPGNQLTTTRVAPFSAAEYRLKQQ